jgi:hypothetical protein
VRLVRRARRAGLSERIVTAVCSSEDLGVAAWSGRVDLAVAIHVIHELAAFGDELTIATPGGFAPVDRPVARRSHAAALSKAERG